MRYLVFSRFLGVFIAQTCLCRTAHGAFTFYTGELTVGRRRTISARQIVLQEQRLHDLDVDCCRNKITCLNAENSMDVEAAEDKSDKIDEREKELTPEEIAELVEVAFVNSVMQLASGLVDVLKLFIVAVKASYERGMNVVKVDGRSSSDGISLLEALDACPVQSANRPLMQEVRASSSTFIRIPSEVWFLLLSTVWILLTNSYACSKLYLIVRLLGILFTRSYCESTCAHMHGLLLLLFCK